MEIESAENEAGKCKKIGVPRVPLPVAYEIEMQRLIEVEAFLRAEKDGFKLPSEDYWHAAEREIRNCFEAK